VTPDIVVIDVSFVSLKDILPAVVQMIGPKTQVLAMVKPQFEAARHQIGSSGVIKNDSVRRAILKDFEQWAKRSFIVKDKADSDVAGARGNKERFYLLQSIYK
jgi:23S rRNA (cytidine1920-2'-O)/16S rRNA (cytidine1409-2'-O)-methyltransferase